MSKQTETLNEQVLLSQVDQFETTLLPNDKELTKQTTTEIESSNQTSVETNNENINQSINNEEKISYLC